jgi:hypothetical protein
MGPQCCNFVEVPHTQQFRLPDWGDYYYVRAGFGPPGVNVENFTATFGAPSSYVGLRTDWNWTVSLSLDWSKPVLFNLSSERASVGIAVTQYVPSAPGKLVYTLVNFWMDQNSSRGLRAFNDGVAKGVSPPNLVTYYPLQLQGEGNQTVVVNLSGYLSDTIRTLNLPTTEAQPPLIAYVYLNVEGYNLRWNTTVWSFNVMTNSQDQQLALGGVAVFLGVALAIGAAAAGLYYLRSRTVTRRKFESDAGRTTTQGTQEPGRAINAWVQRNRS